MEKRGSLIAVGTGIRIAGQLTVEAIASMRQADRLLYIASDAISTIALERLNPSCSSLAVHYAEGTRRMVSYEKMIDQILENVRDGWRTCVAFYGHPGVFAYPTHEAIRRAREEGFEARMLPAISAEDCLFADLGVDPARYGCQSYEATDFLVSHPMIDPSAAVILWQVGVVGELDFRPGLSSPRGLPMLISRLCEYYPSDHRMTVYEASLFPGTDPSVQSVPLHDLPEARLSSSSTLYIPPARTRRADRAVWARLGAATSGDSHA
jgi:uncharacterized protein YabN with tetrapyrrole methylase and pyrophosphatase domain